MTSGSYMALRAGQRTLPTSISGLKLRTNAAVCSVSVMVSTSGVPCWSAAWRPRERPAPALSRQQRRAVDVVDDLRMADHAHVGPRERVIEELFDRQTALGECGAHGL